MEVNMMPVVSITELETYIYNQYGVQFKNFRKHLQVGSNHYQYEYFAESDGDPVVDFIHTCLRKIVPTSYDDCILYFD